VDQLEIFNYWAFVVLMMVGFYGVIAKTNLFKKIVSLGLFQTAIFLLYISMAVTHDGVAPIAVEGDAVDYNNPIPHVLMLTAIVVSIAVTAVGLALAMEIKRAYGTIETDEIERIEQESR